MHKPNVPLDKIRDQIADAIAVHVSAQNVPSVYVSVGIQDRVQEEDASDAFRSKRSYVKRHLLERPKTDLLQIAERVLTEFDAPDLQDSLSELTSQADLRISVISRKEVLNAFNAVDNSYPAIPIFWSFSPMFSVSR